MNFSHTNDDSLFYCDIEITEETNRFINPLKEYSIQHSKQIYILKKALGTNKDYNYELSDVAIILMPKHPILILNYKTTTLENLEDFLLDFKEDLGYLSDKYNSAKYFVRTRKTL